jgi:CheY-like chemotaxis protein
MVTVLEPNETKRPLDINKNSKDNKNNKDNGNGKTGIEEGQEIHGKKDFYISEQDKTKALPPFSSTSHYSSNLPSEHSRTPKALVAEPERDILLLYQIYLKNLGFSVITVEDGDKALEYALQQRATGHDYEINSDKEKDNKNKENKENKGNYDLVILNTRLGKKNGVDVAKEIRKKNPKQRIIITTTNQIENLPGTQLELVKDMDKVDILILPFKFSKLRSMIKDQGHS